MLKRKRGQSTLEYVLVLTAIIAAIILVAGNFLYPKVRDAYHHVANEMSEQVAGVNFGK